MPDLAEDYLQGKPEVLEFFNRPPHSWLENIRKDRQLHDKIKALKVQRGVSTLPEENGGKPVNAIDFISIDASFCRTLLKYQKALGLKRTLTGQEQVVITGQQPGLLTGPLYTIYKAITAITLAEEIAAAYRSPVVPVFWIAADDHDFEEVRSANILTRKHELLTLRYEPKQDVTDMPMFMVPLEESLHDLIDEAARAAPGSEFSEDVRSFLHDSLAQSSSFSNWFARIMAQLFKDTPLLLFTTELDGARTEAQSVFFYEANAPLETTRMINEAASKLKKLGYEPQLQKKQNECNFFLLEKGQRKKLIFDGLHFWIPGTGRKFTIEEITSKAISSPQYLSASAALRPIVQQELFHPDAYVGGPGEIAYWAQLKGVFEKKAQIIPVVYPRSRALLKTVKLNKLMRKYGLELGMLEQGQEAALNHAMVAAEGAPALNALRPEKQRLLEQTEQMLRALEDAKASPALRGMGESFLAQLRQNLDRLEQAAARDDDRQVQTVRAHIERLVNSLAPQRKPQERMLSIFSFLFEQGWDLIPRLVQELDPKRFDLQEIEL